MPSMGEAIQRGIGAAFHVNAETRAMRNLFTTLRQVGISPIDPLDAHITLVDCAETQIPVFSDRDQVALNKARRGAGDYLATLPYYELVFHSSGHELEPFGTRLAVVIKEEDELRLVRDHIGEIFEEEAGIALSSRDWIPHLSVGRKTRGAKVAARNVSPSRLPTNIHIVGHDVSEKTFVEDPRRQRSMAHYVNASRAKRGRRT